MNYTWGDIQILALKKMFLNNVPISVEDLDDLKEDRKYNLYLNAMPEAANEGLLRLMTRGTPIVKKYTLSQLYGEDVIRYINNDTQHIEKEDIVIEVDNAFAYYFEINNEATITFEKYNSLNELETLVEINHIPDISGSFEVYKGILSVDEGDNIKVTFKEDGYRYSIRNLALYNVKFRSEDEVLDNTLTQRYNLRDLIRDYYELVSVEYQPDGSKGKYNSDYTLEGDSTLIIDTKKRGNYIITYKAYPPKITEQTTDGYRFTLPSEMIAILPLYIASELYKDDDISISTQYRNQFEAELDGLKIINAPMEFTSNTGWL